MDAQAGPGQADEGWARKAKFLTGGGMHSGIMKLAGRLGRGQLLLATRHAPDNKLAQGPASRDAHGKKFNA